MADGTTGQVDAIENLKQTFAKYNLGTLGDRIAEYVYQGYSNDTIAMMLQDTPEYKQRFSGNDARLKAGLPVLSPAEYLATEEAYRQVLRSAGLPKGFYDSSDDFAKFISNDISPTEIKQRVDMAAKAVDNTDPYYTQSLREMYGLSTGDMIAHLLDPDKAQPMVLKQARAAEFGAAAARQGLQVTAPSQYEQYAAGVGTGVGAEQGMQAVAEMLPEMQKLGAISGDQYTQQTAEQEVFGGLASAKRKRQQLMQQEESRFTGRSNVDTKSLQGGLEGMI